MSRISTRALPFLVLALSCGDANDDENTAPRPPGNACEKESDAAFCIRLGKTCGVVSGVDLCGVERTNFSCGSCPTTQSFCGFVGDPSGATDSTQALRDAIQCSIDNGFAQVKIGKGTFAVAEKIVVPERVPLVGEEDGTFGMNGPTPYDALPILRFPSGLADDALVLSKNASITGVQFVAGGQAGETHAVIRIAGEDIAIRNVKITSGQWGILSNAATDARGAFISNVFMVAPRGGVSIAKATDTTRVENVHVWNNDGNLATTSAFSFHNVKGLVAPLLSTFNYQTALEVQDSEMTVLGFQGDLCVNGLVASGTSNVVVSGGSFFSHFTSLSVDDSSRVSMSGSFMTSNGNPTVWVRSSSASLALSGSTIIRDADGFSPPAMRVDGARLLSITGNTIRSGATGILFTAGATGGSVYGNTIDIVNSGTAWSPSGVGGVAFKANATNAAP